MQIIKKTILAAAAFLAAGSAMALPTFTYGNNSINFVGYENQYRTFASCTTFGACLAHNATNDPAGYNRVDPTSSGDNSVLAGDTFAGIFRVTQTQPGNWNPTGTDQFTGYFAQTVESVTGASLTTAKINLMTATIDPFGILAKGAMYALYSDVGASTTNFDPNGTTFQSIALATDGTLWGSLALTGAETYNYSLSDLSVAADVATGAAIKSYLALDFLTYGSSYNAGTLRKVNDLSEALVGGTTASGLLSCGAADLASSTVTCSDIVGNADVKRNANFTSGASAWYFEVNDPLSLNTIPEPGSLALVGLSLLGLGMVSRRRRNS